jgi:pimeloyl-ACP methyl ester carboxylesterase
MTATATRQRREEANEIIAIRPLRFEAADAALDEMRRRIIATRFPEKEPLADPSQGVQFAFIQALARLGDRLRLADVRDAPERSSPVHHRDQRDPARMVRAWVELMKRLGYSRFAAQGGDWGAFVTSAMAQQAPQVDRHPCEPPRFRAL